MFEVSAESQPPNESTINVRGHDDINSSRNLYTNVRVAILSGILFLSGIGALIFETLWLRLSGLAFGNSIWAAALILSSFMAGLALGNAIAAWSKVRRWRPPALESAERNRADHSLGKCVREALDASRKPVTGEPGPAKLDFYLESAQMSLFF